MNSTVNNTATSVNENPSQSTGVRTLAYFKNLQRDPNRWGNWHRDTAAGVLSFEGGWFITLADLRTGADAFHAMADFAKYSTTADDVADLGRAIRKIMPRILS